MPPRSVARSDFIRDASLRMLHPLRIEGAAEIRALLIRAGREGVPLQRGTNRRAVPERAWIESVGRNELSLATRDFGPDQAPRLFLNFRLDGIPYFFACELLERRPEGRLRVALPELVHQAERRDRTRAAVPGEEPGLRLLHAGDEAIEVGVMDRSADGLSVRLPGDHALAPGANVELRSLEGELAPQTAEVRNRRDAGSGWVRIGLRLTPGARRGRLEVERRDSILAGERSVREEGVAERLSGATWSREVRIQNARDETICGTLDGVGEDAAAPVVVIPPAWGRTKETLLALSETLLATFGLAGRSVRVLRFDGIRRRGSSHNEAAGDDPDAANVHYTFSQGVRDILTVAAWVAQAPELREGPRLLVTFSAAAVEGRRALVVAPGAFSSWVSVVGASDPQHMIRVVSGGVDYFGGAERGVEFGRQDIQGLLLDVDNATRDALAARIAFLEDARRDFAKLDLPVTWIHGRYDAWTPLERILDAYSCGDVSRRRLIEVPTGHQLRESEEAFDVFGLVAAECARQAIEEPLPIRRADRRRIRQRQRAERQRRKERQVDLKRFWHDYLVGRDGDVGIEFMTSISAFRDFMAQQIQALQLEEGQRVLDLGAGTGSFPIALVDTASPSCRVVELDVVVDGLRRARQRVHGLAGGLSLVAADLDGPGAAVVPLADGSVDAVISSLVLSYLRDPSGILRELARVLRPGGRLVLSGMRRDADISRICVGGVAEIRTGAASRFWDDVELESIDAPLQRFLSNGARLLDLEEEGRFQFLDADAFAGLVASAGFHVEAVTPGYGDPPQAVVVTAVAGR